MQDVGMPQDATNNADAADMCCRDIMTPPQPDPQRTTNEEMTFEIFKRLRIAIF